MYIFFNSFNFHFTKKEQMTLWKMVSGFSLTNLSECEMR